MKNLKVYVDVFGRLSFMEKFPDDEEHDGLNEMLKEMIEQDGSCDEPSGFYMAEMDIEIEETYSWDGPDDDAYMTIKELVPVGKPSGIAMTDAYIDVCKEIDPSLKSIKIVMKGRFNREITREF